MRTQVKAALPLILLTLAFAGARAAQQSADRRLTPTEINEITRHNAGAGTSGVAGIQTTVLSGNPSAPGLYTIKLRVPANTQIQAHSHKDSRSASVVSGTWYIGYGTRFDAGQLKALPAGSFYTEPPGKPHFAQTTAEPVVVYITGY